MARELKNALRFLSILLQLDNDAFLTFLEEKENSLMLIFSVFESAGKDLILKLLIKCEFFYKHVLFFFKSYENDDRFKKVIENFSEVLEKIRSEKGILESVKMTNSQIADSGLRITEFVDEMQKKPSHFETILVSCN